MLRNFHNNSVLIIDDVKLSREIVAHLLRKHGIEHIYHAEDGNEGIELCMKLKPDLMIVDLMMPGMDGYEFCRRIRQDKDFQDTPIIVQTSMENVNRRIDAFSAGASDLVLKPVNPRELLQRMILHLQRHRLLLELRNYHERTSRELEAAREMQFSFLPAIDELHDIMSSLPLSIRHFYEPSTLLSGDMLGMKQLDEDRLAFYLLDFAGHGMIAALNTSRLHTIIHTQLSFSAEPGEYLTRLNRVVYPILKPQEYATMLYGVIDVKRHSLSYASAASPQPIILTQGKTNPSILDSAGVPLGVLPDANYLTHTVEFNPGDMLFAFSDALIEAKKNPTQMLNEPALHELCYEYMACSPSTQQPDPEHFMNWILDMYQTYALTTQYQDDMTLLLVSHLRKAA